ncbi:hypothetical protein [Mycobacterium lepromatosis]|uniref:Uncharacterized protein n=1 Tax=Mycobacterium lepromatosis TaxID=480418 RepID=A0A0F4EQ49_9MYCO|nr:hypothetical protein [Mycobacterium lepromatosis]KJX74742.1 hypothetical protein MLPM_2172 [Mycobacterium lepromatosis]
MLKTTNIVDSAASFAITVNGTPTVFRIDNAFTRWMSSKGDGLEHNLPALARTVPGQPLPDLVYRALSVGMLVDDAGIEFNVRPHRRGRMPDTNQRHC